LKISISPKCEHIKGRFNLEFSYKEQYKDTEDLITDFYLDLGDIVKDGVNNFLKLYGEEIYSYNYNLCFHNIKKINKDTDLYIKNTSDKNMYINDISLYDFFTSPNIVLEEYVDNITISDKIGCESEYLQMSEDDELPF
jgi:hypothetical protein